MVDPRLLQHHGHLLLLPPLPDPLVPLASCVRHSKRRKNLHGMRRRLPLLPLETSRILLSQRRRHRRAPPPGLRHRQPRDERKRRRCHVSPHFPPLLRGMKRDKQSLVAQNLQLLDQPRSGLLCLGVKHHPGERRGVRPEAPVWLEVQVSTAYGSEKDQERRCPTLSQRPGVMAISCG